MKAVRIGCAGWAYGAEGRYSERELATWRRRIAAWRARTEVVGYFNNDAGAFAFENARALGHGLS